MGLEIHHIVPWARGGEHLFENLILLCANCHSRVTRGEIDSKSVRAYKANLGIIGARYGDLERRVLERFVKDSALEHIVVDRSHEVLLTYLVADGMLVLSGPAEGAVAISKPDGGEPEVYMGPAVWRLTAEGRELVDRLRNADSAS
ncbi:HNH endonuclease signature motif containing protein [Cellulomonas citrea]|uniref:HNH endonuclease signature motif containing protein n=1 Tax=Cellulomonas citrea TaxID=1909423 RepID=UPI001914E24F